MNKATTNVLQSYFVLTEAVLESINVSRIDHLRLVFRLCPLNLTRTFCRRFAISDDQLCAAVQLQQVLPDSKLVVEATNVAKFQIDRVRGVPDVLLSVGRPAESIQVVDAARTVTGATLDDSEGIVPCLGLPTSRFSTLRLDLVDAYVELVFGGLRLLTTDGLPFEASPG